MTDEFNVVTDGNRESFIHGTHTERSPITPINLNKTQVCQHHPSPPCLSTFSWRYRQGHQLRAIMGLHPYPVFCEAFL